MNATKQSNERLVSLDVFRGITIAGMVLVNNPGTWSSIYWPLAHAEWHGWTPTDLIFPFFLFIVGVAIPLAFGRRLEAGNNKRDLYLKITRSTNDATLPSLLRSPVAKPGACRRVINSQ